jgi:hypothetical protein
VLPTQKKSLIPIIKTSALTSIKQKAAEVGMKNFVYHTSRNCFASIRTYNTRLSTRIANRTHAGKRAVSGLVFQITITSSSLVMVLSFLSL